MINEFCKGYIRIHRLPSDFKGSGSLRVHLANHSNHDWKSEGEHPVFLCYHWLDEKWNMVVYDGFRTALIPDGLRAGNSASFSVEIDPPPKPGAYNLVLTLVRDGMFWFDRADDFQMETVKIGVAQDVLRQRPKQGPSNDAPKTAGSGVVRPDPLDARNGDGPVDRSSSGATSGSDLIRAKASAKERKFGFMHIPKTSGSAMRAFLAKAMNLATYFKEADLSQHSFLKDVPDPVLPIGENYLAHVSFGTLLKGCPDGQYLTIFREASSRILSHWVFWRTYLADEYGEERVKRVRGRFIDFLSYPEIACQVDNISLRMLVWPHPRVPNDDFIDRKDDEELLQLALDRLKRFSFLDVIENPQFEANLQDWLGTELNYSRVNVSQSMPKHLRVPLYREFTPETLEALKARSRLDRVLWTAVAAARMPGIDLAELSRNTLIRNVARYAAIMA